MQKILNQSINRQRTHYLKWELYLDNRNTMWSVRLYFTDDSKNQLNGWVLKNHNTKQIIKLTRREALLYIKHFAKYKRANEYFSIGIKNKYFRYILNPDGKMITQVNPK